MSDISRANYNSLLGPSQKLCFPGLLDSNSRPTDVDLSVIASYIRSSLPIFGELALLPPPEKGPIAGLRRFHIPPLNASGFMVGVNSLSLYSFKLLHELQLNPIAPSSHIAYPLAREVP